MNYHLALFCVVFLCFLYQTAINPNMLVTCVLLWQSEYFIHRDLEVFVKLQSSFFTQGYLGALKMSSYLREYYNISSTLVVGLECILSQHSTGA